MDAKTARAFDRWIMNPPELEDEEVDPNGDCRHPGPRGCGQCPGCSDWGDMELEQRRDRELEEL
jgi:hypothetical protein